MLDSLDQILSPFDEPFADSSAIPTYFVSRETKKHVTVALSGDGGDELFGGYRSYLSEYWRSKYMMIPEIMRNRLIEPVIKRFPDSRDSRGREFIRRLKKFTNATHGQFPERILALKEVFPKYLRQSITIGHRIKDDDTDPSLIWIKNFLNYYQGDKLNSILYTDLKDSLPGDMLMKVDLMSMKNSLEVRVPFLDHRVVEMAFQMIGSLKLQKGKTKYILKETFKELLPANVYCRPKAGFEVPISRWLRNEMKFLLDQYLNEHRLKVQGLFDPKTVNQLTSQHLSGRKDTSWLLWNLIAFQKWYENYFL
jgi:asparagine synthase (glutamine-hydrolysing)